MNRTYKFILLLMITSIFFSCRKDEIKYEEDIIIVVPAEDGEVKLQGHITDPNKQSIAGAEVSVGDLTVVTDEYGYFIMDDAEVLNGNLVMVIEKEDYIHQYRKIPIVEGMKDVFVRASMLSNQGIEFTFESDQLTTITGNGGHRVTFEANSIVNENGSEYNGTVVFSSYYIDPTRSDLADIMPGDLSAINLQGEEVQLVSFGMLYGDLSTPTGAPLQIKDGVNATVELEIQSSQLDNAADQIPLWSLDEQTATWLEEGVAIKQGNKYVAKVSHFSFWNCDAPFPIVEVRGCAIDQYGVPIANTFIFVSVSDLGDARYCSTDRNGCFQGKFPKGEDLLIGLYNDCGNESVQVFGAFQEMTNVGDITFDISEFGYVVEGVILDCQSSPIFPGLLEITDSNNAVSLFAADEDGTFTTTIFSCAGQQISVRAINPTELESSDFFSHDILLDEVNDFGNIIACETTIDYFFRMIIDGQVLFFMDPVANRKGSILELVGINNAYNVNVLIEENDLVAPIKEVIVFLSDGTAILFWDEECNDFVDFQAIQVGGVGEVVEGGFSGTYQGVAIEVEYRQVVQNELTPIKGLVWDDLNQDGIRDLGEPTVQDVKILIENSSININTSTRTDENGEYVLFGSHLDINSLQIELPDGYTLTEDKVGMDDTKDSDYIFSGGNAVLQLSIQSPGEISENIDAGIHLDPNIACDAVKINDPCIVGDGDLCSQLISTEGGVDFTFIRVMQGGAVVQEIGPQSSPYELCGLSYNEEYNVKCFLSNGVECEVLINEAGVIQNPTTFYVRYTQCDPLLAEVDAIPNQEDLQDVDYVWSNGITNQTVNMVEGETLSVATTDDDGCELTYEYTLEKHNLAIGGVAWIDSDSGDSEVLDPSDQERFGGLRISLHNMNGDLVEEFQTGKSGVYQFYLDVPPGDYYVYVHNFNSLYELVAPYVGSDTTIDSDFDPITKQSSVFTVTGACQLIENYDVGITKI